MVCLYYIITLIKPRKTACNGYRLTTSTSHSQVGVASTEDNIKENQLLNEIWLSPNHNQRNRLQNSSPERPIHNFLRCESLGCINSFKINLLAFGIHFNYFNEILFRYAPSSNYHFNQVGPSDAIRWHRSRSTLAQAVTCYPTAPNH